MNAVLKPLEGEAPHVSLRSALVATGELAPWEQADNRGVFEQFAEGLRVQRRKLVRPSLPQGDGWTGTLVKEIRRKAQTSVPTTPPPPSPFPVTGLDLDTMFIFRGHTEGSPREGDGQRRCPGTCAGWLGQPCNEPCYMTCFLEEDVSYGDRNQTHACSCCCAQHDQSLAAAEAAGRASLSLPSEFNDTLQGLQALEAGGAATWEISRAMKAPEAEEVGGLAVPGQVVEVPVIRKRPKGYQDYRRSLELIMSQMEQLVLRMDYWYHAGPNAVEGAEGEAVSWLRFGNIPRRDTTAGRSPTDDLAKFGMGVKKTYDGAITKANSRRPANCDVSPEEAVSLRQALANWQSEIDCSMDETRRGQLGISAEVRYGVLLKNKRGKLLDHGQNEGRSGHDVRTPPLKDGTTCFVCVEWKGGPPADGEGGSTMGTRLGSTCANRAATQIDETDPKVGVRRLKLEDGAR